MRSRQHGEQTGVIPRGITSACAEQTPPGTPSETTSWDYLSVCGADIEHAQQVIDLGGLPQRVRSRPGAARSVWPMRGITSACAEQTVVFYCVLSQLNGVEYLIYALRRVS